jgi:hypothetical protein
VLEIRRLITSLVLLSALAFAPSAAASSTQMSIIEAPAQMQSDLAGTLAEMRALGATQVRYPIHWDAIAPSVRSQHAPSGFNASDPSSYPQGNWAFVDQVVRQAYVNGLSVDFLIAGPAPRWAEAAGEPRGGNFGVWKPNATAYGAFVQALGRRYSGTYTPGSDSTPLPRVSFWGIWNEPNYGQDLAPQATGHDMVELSPAAYRGLVNHAWSGLAATGHGHDTILVGETAPHGHPHPIGNFDLIAPLRFIQVLYCLDANFHQFRGSAARVRGCPTTSGAARRFRAQNPGLFNATGFALHPYAAGAPPNRSQPGSIKGAADLAAIPLVERTLDRAFRSYGSGRRIAIYNTEYGYQVGGKVTPTLAATYINWAEYISYKNARIASYAQYLLNDPPNHRFLSGLNYSGGRPKPSLDAYRMPLYMPTITVGHPRTLEVWGGVRPSYFAQLDSGDPPQALVQFRRRGSATFSTIKVVSITNPRGYFDLRLRFSTSGTVRTTWTNAGRTLHSRSVTVTVG